MRRGPGRGRVGRLVFGAADPKAGACGSLYNLCADPRLNHEVPVTAGVRADEAADLLSRVLRRAARAVAVGTAARMRLPCASVRERYHRGLTSSDVRPELPVHRAGEGELLSGGMRERTNRAVSKTVVPLGTVGSNPTPSAKCVLFKPTLRGYRCPRLS